MKFKAGDKVKKVTNEGSNFRPGAYGDISEVGKTYTVERYYDCEPGNYLKLRECALGEFDHCFELVEEGMTELEELVKKANEGYEATQQIYIKYHDAVEFRDHSYPEEQWDSPPFWGTRHRPSKLRIKTKPKFEPFTVGRSWLVKLEDKTLHIGCRTYDAKWIKQNFELMSRKDSNVNRVEGSKKLAACRKGISESGETITWEDAEKILAALEKAGVK